MIDLLIVTPSRGRPQQFANFVRQVNKTCETAWQIWLGLDEDDPTADEYYEELKSVRAAAGVVGYREPRMSLSAWTNHLAQLALQQYRKRPPRYMASLGDDHYPTTKGWDRMLIEAIETSGRPGWAYGDDGIQRHRLPTAWVVSTPLVQALGYVMLPTCRHMYVDNAVLDLGRLTGRIHYVPEAKIDHRHPVGGRARWDKTYRGGLAATHLDREAYDEWRAGGGLDADVAKVMKT